MDMDSPPEHPRRRSRGGCCLLVFIAFMFTPMTTIGALVVFGAVNLDSLKSLVPGSDSGMSGSIVTATYVPKTRVKGAKSKKRGRLWVLTDPSFYYTKEVETPGRHSISRECFRCSLQLNIVDPVTRDVDRHVTWEFDGPPADHAMVQTGNDVWIVATGDENPRVLRYNGKSGKRAWSMKTFLKKNPDLKAGIAKLRFKPNSGLRQIEIKTLDGLEYVYTFATRSLTEKGADKASKQDVVGRFALFEEKTDERKQLRYLRGSAWQVQLAEMSGSAKGREVEIEPVGDEVYFEPWFVYQDDEVAVLLHQDRLGKTASRSLTCVERGGRTRWTVAGEELFEELYLDENENPLSQTFFMKGKARGELHGKVFVFALKDAGVLGLDASSGDLLWELRN